MVGRNVYVWPNGDRDNCNEAPNPVHKNPDYMGGTWVLDYVNSLGMNVYKLSLPTVEVHFKTVECGRESIVTYNSDSLPSEENLPRIPVIEGMKGVWPKLPHVIRNELTLKPIYSYIVYRAIFLDLDGNPIEVKFTIKDLPIKPPKLSKKKGYKNAIWEKYDEFNCADLVISSAAIDPVKIYYNREKGLYVLYSDTFYEKLPKIEQDKKHYRKKWFVPSIEFSDVDAVIVETPIDYTAVFIDYYSKREVLYSIEKQPVVPPISNKKGYKAEWEKFELTYSSSPTVINAVYTPINVIFKEEGKEPIIQKYTELSLPKLEQNRPWYHREWKIPDVYSTDVEATVVEIPLEYTLIIHTDGGTQVCKWSIEKKVALPSLPKNIGVRSYWDTEDGIEVNQYESGTYDLYPHERPIEITLHYSKEKEEKISYDGEINLPIVPGCKWSDYTIASKDIDIYLMEETNFSLFYVNKKLRYCVPFTKSDHHYVDEMNSSPTVPRYGGSCGKWVKIESLDGYERYVADYTKKGPDFKENSTSIDWDIDNVLSYLYESDGIVNLNGVDINLYDTDYVKITGFNEKIVENNRSCCLFDWLNKEKIPYWNNAEYYYCTPFSKNRTKMTLGKCFNSLQLSGRKEYVPAIMFLIEQGFNFIYHFTVDGRGFRFNPAYYLQQFVIYEGDTEEDKKEAFEELWPVNRLIPPLNPIPVETDYYRLKVEKKLVTVGDMESSTKGADVVYDIHQTIYDPDCSWEVIDEKRKHVKLVKYLGNERDYEIPKYIKIKLGDADRYKVTAIGDEAFSDNVYLRSISATNFVEVVEDYAFYNCEYLKSVVFSDSIKKICSDAFVNCGKLKYIELPSKNVKYSKSTFKKLGVEIKQEFKEGSSKNIPENTPKEADLSGILSEMEMEFLRRLCSSQNSDEAAKGLGRSKSLLMKNINEKLSILFDSDEGIFDENGSIIDDYIEKIKKIIGD